MKTIAQARLTGERALFGEHDCEITDTIFDDGESPLKESRNITLRGSMFKWKYPLWYAKDIRVSDSTWFDMARAGVWYSDRVTVERCAVEAPKNFRRCHDLTLSHVSFANAAETLWECEGVVLDDITAKGDYFAMNSRDMTVSGLTLYGNYSFDGCRNLTVENSRLLNTTLAFEYSTVDAEIVGHIDSVKNPRAGRLVAGSIGDLILEPERVNPDATEILLGEGVPNAV